MKAALLLVFCCGLLSSVALARAQEQESVTLGVQLFKRGLLPEARQFCEAFIQRHPHNTSGAFYLGRLAFEERDYGQAIEWFEKAVQQDHDNSDYQLWLGRAYGYEALRSSIFRQPFLALKVKAHFERAVELNPDNLDAREGLKEYYEQAPRFLGGSTEKARVQGEELEKRKQQAHR